MIPRREIRILFKLLFLAAPFALWGQLSSLTQQQKKEGQKEESTSDTVKIVPIPLTNIPTATNETFNRMSELIKEQLTGEEKEKFVSEVDTFVSSSNAFLGDSLVSDLEHLSSRELNNLKGRNDILSGQVTSLQSGLSKRSGSVEESIQGLNTLKKRWELTLERSGQEPLPEALVERMNRVIFGIDSVRSVLQADLEFLLNQQNRLADQNMRITLLSEQIKKQNEALAGKLLVRDMPGFFKALKDFAIPGLLSTHMKQIRNAVRSDMLIARSEYRKQTIFVIFFFLILLGFASWYRINYKKVILAEVVPESEFHKILIRAPFFTTLFLTTLLVRFAYPDLPHTQRAVNLMALMVPTLVFVMRMFHTHVRKWFPLLAVVFVLTFFYEFLFYPDAILRIVLMFYSVTSLIFFVWVLRSRVSGGTIRNQFLYKSLRFLMYTFCVLVSISIIANLVGAFRLAEYLTLVPVQIFIAAMAIFVTTKVAGTIVYLLLISQGLHRLNFIREDFQTIYKKTTRLFNIVLWIVFASSTLKILRVQEEVFDWGNNWLTTGFHIGAVEITPRSILVFILVIWISVVVTRIISRILEKDVFVRVETARGVPSTILMLLRIALITGGFFLAAAAAGMELTNLSIVLGAFSVGIGFGLQNIFNNMVSGLILAFERPIKVGDTVQVGDLVGIVLSIGLRSSVVRSYDGAEVIVPNGNLISDQMINWTKSDAKRRMDIRVGVTYGTDPEKVVAILEEVASAHKHVDRFPEPRGYFIGFGDSSLDFRLLAWTDIDKRFETESEINVTINTKLKEAGIEIPFPQRDLHIRSDDTRSKPPEKTG